MKQLLLIRHAKSDWDVEEYPDFARPLNKRGIKEALTEKENLKKWILNADVILCSPSVRTIQTLSLLTGKSLSEIPQLKLISDIYLANKETLKNTIDFYQESDFVTLIGHNDGISDLLNMLLKRQDLNFPTCGWALMEFEGRKITLLNKNF